MIARPSDPPTLALGTVFTCALPAIHTCSHYDRTFTSNIGLVGYLRIHGTETGEPAPGAPTYTRRVRLYGPHCPRAFTHSMGLFGHMRVHESGNDRSLDTPSTS
ncbi:hypothetical protein SprV_0100388900 [Sparganum proliferum]